MAGGSARTLVSCPKALAMTRENRFNCSSFSVSLSSSSSWGARLSSRLPFLLPSGFLPDTSPLWSGSPPPPGSPAALPRGGDGRFLPPAPNASRVRSDVFPFTCLILCSTRALSTAISPSWACCDCGFCLSSSFMRLMLILWFSSSHLCCSLIRALSWSKSVSRCIDCSPVACTTSWSWDVTPSCLVCRSFGSPSRSATWLAKLSSTFWDSKSKGWTCSSIRASSRPTIWTSAFNWFSTVTYS